MAAWCTFGGANNFLGRQTGLLRVAIPLPVTIRRRLPFALHGRRAAGEQNHGDVRGQVIPKVFSVLEEQRQVVFRALGRHSLAQLAKHFCPPGIGGKPLPKAFPERLHAA